MEAHGSGDGNGGSEQDGWSRVEPVMDGSAPMPGQPVDENFVSPPTRPPTRPPTDPVVLCAGAVQWAEIGVWFSEDGATGHAQNGTMPPLGGRTRGAPHTHTRARAHAHTHHTHHHSHHTRARAYWCTAMFWRCSCVTSDTFARRLRRW